MINEVLVCKETLAGFMVTLQLWIQILAVILTGEMPRDLLKYDLLHNGTNKDLINFVIMN